mmetsp:Transcript_22956/g.45567  ORF Transcript_22956/g.45567 Transcript_22956/m.45567 type:complete len:150 (-) Transcript_22956:153-602(-)
MTKNRRVQIRTKPPSYFGEKEMASLTIKRISQKTFDECVRENVEELEMEKDEALADAIAQFKSQGVDLTNIDTSGADREDQRRATSAAIELLREAVTTKDGTPDEIKCRIALLDLTYACRVDKQEVLLVEEEEKEEERKWRSWSGEKGR